MFKAFFELVSLPWIYLAVLFKEKRWQREVKKTYYSCNAFQKQDKFLSSLYRSKSPFAVAKAFAKERQDENQHTFGATPLHVYDALITRWIKESQGSYLELGSGTGRGLLFLHAFSCLDTSGVERNPYFVNRSLRLIECFGLSRIDVTLGDYLQMRAFDYDWIYLYELFLSDHSLQDLCAAICLSCKKTTKVISVSYPLSDYDQRFKVEDSFEASFVWGKAQVFLNALIAYSGD